MLDIFISIHVQNKLTLARADQKSPYFTILLQYYYGSKEAIRFLILLATEYLSVKSIKEYFNNLYNTMYVIFYFENHLT